MTEPGSQTCSHGEVRFPVGLIQPVERFRFSVDALLLAAFGAALCLPPRFVSSDLTNATQEDTRHPSRWPLRPMDTFVDVGTGCGVVGLGFLLLARKAWASNGFPFDSMGISGTGIDNDTRMVAAANSNSRLLDLHACFTAIETRVEELLPQPGTTSLIKLGTTSLIKPSTASQVKFGTAGLVLTNPPWRVRGTGRPCPSPWREQALFGGPNTLWHFAHAGARLLRPGGLFVSVVGATRLADQLEAVRGVGMGVMRLRFVHARAGQVASMVLLAARAQVKDDLHVEPPLFLYDQEGGVPADTLQFCPFLCGA